MKIIILYAGRKYKPSFSMKYGHMNKDNFHDIVGQYDI